MAVVSLKDGDLVAIDVWDGTSVRNITGMVVGKKFNAWRSRPMYRIIVGESVELRENIGSQIRLVQRGKSN